MQSETARCLRDGAWRHDLPARELVPGDLIEIRTGDRVPADARVTLRTATVRLDQASLTGESVSVGKSVEPVRDPDCELQAKECVAFGGTAATQGQCRAVDRHRDAHGDRKDPSADPTSLGRDGRHAFEAEAGRFRGPADVGNRGDMPAGVGDELPVLHRLDVVAVAAVCRGRDARLLAVHVLLQDRGRAGRRRDPRGAARGDHHLPRARHEEDGQEERHRAQVAVGGDSRMHVGDFAATRPARSPPTRCPPREWWCPARR